MRKLVARKYRSVLALARSEHSGKLIVAVAAVLILLQLGFRAWALYPSWFYGDDYLLFFAAQKGLSLDYLLEAHNGHLMPAGRLLVWMVLTVSGTSWALVATTTLLLQAAASIAALWMLVVLLGPRWGILAPLSLYLFGTLTLPAFMWWAAALTQLPTQIGFFVAVGAWVLHLRDRHLASLVTTGVAVAFGLAFDVKALLILPVLVFLMVAYFSQGSTLQRLRSTIQRYWLAGAALGTAAIAYTAYYVLTVDTPVVPVSLGALGRTAENMWGVSFLAAAIGGPWTWGSVGPPSVAASPPMTLVHLAWVVATLVILYAALTRHRSLRAWVLLAGYLVILLGLVTSRIGAYGPVTGLNFRFLTDAACALSLALALAYLPLRGARESVEPRAEPLLRLRVPAAAPAIVVFAVCVSSVISSVGFIGYWHTQNPSADYLISLRAELRAKGAVDLVDTVVPEPVIGAIVAPANRVRRAASLFPNQARFPTTSPDLRIVDSKGRIRPAEISPGLKSPPGPDLDCGWRIDSAERRIPLEASASDYSGWIRVGYLASASSPITITLGETQVETRVRRGLHSVFLQATGTFDSVRVGGLAPGTVMCVGDIQVGDAVPKEPS